MREALTDLIVRRHPGLFRADGTSFSHFGFQHGDGWFSIVDTLFGFVEPGGAVRQIKEKFGGLRFYVDGTNRGAVAVAEALSLRVCEVTGRAGCLTNRGGCSQTLSPETARKAGAEAWGEDAKRSIALLGPAAALAALKERRTTVAIDVPPGWADLVDCFASALLGEGFVTPQNLPDLRAIRRSGGRLVVEADRLDDKGRAAVVYSQAIAERTDPSTGDTGPVDNAGLPVWVG